MLVCIPFFPVCKVCPYHFIQYHSGPTFLNSSCPVPVPLRSGLLLSVQASPSHVLHSDCCIALLVVTVLVLVFSHPAFPVLIPSDCLEFPALVPSTALHSLHILPCSTIMTLYFQDQVLVPCTTCCAQSKTISLYLQIKHIILLIFIFLHLIDPADTATNTLG